MAYDLYVITDETLSHGLSHEEIARQAIHGGADVIQLRDKTAGGKRLLEAALRIRVETRRTGALFIVNDRVDIALASGADGVHLGKEDMPLSRARIMMPKPYVSGYRYHRLKRPGQPAGTGPIMSPSVRCSPPVRKQMPARDWGLI